MSQQLASTSASMGIGTLRVCPFVLENDTAIDRVGAEVTTVGDAGSKVRLGIYADNGSRYPGALLVDAGQIAGDSASLQNIDLSSPAVLPAGVYWMGAVIQAVTTTQPTLRVTASWSPPFTLDLGQTQPSANAAVVGYSMTGVTGALPATFSTTVATINAGPRLWMTSTVA